MSKHYQATAIPAASTAISARPWTASTCPAAAVGDAVLLALSEAGSVGALDKTVIWAALIVPVPESEVDVAVLALPELLADGVATGLPSDDAELPVATGIVVLPEADGLVLLAEDPLPKSSLQYIPLMGKVLVLRRAGTPYVKVVGSSALSADHLHWIISISTPVVEVMKRYETGISVLNQSWVVVAGVQYRWGILTSETSKLVQWDREGDGVPTPSGSTDGGFDGDGCCLPNAESGDSADGDCHRYENLGRHGGVREPGTVL